MLRNAEGFTYRQAPMGLRAVCDRWQLLDSFVTNKPAQPLVRILKVARTIADLEAVEDLEPKHLSETVQYRTLDRNLCI